jgi:O-antigen/teichoic acid export membrane protein
LYLPGRVGAALIGFLTLLVFTHFFTPAEVGRYDNISRTVTLLCAVSVLWVNVVIMRFYAAFERDEKLDVFLRVVQIMRLGGVLVGCAVFAIIWMVGPDSIFGTVKSFFIIVPFIFVYQSLFETGVAMFRAKSLPIKMSVASLLNAAGRFGLGLALALWIGWGVAGLLWATAIVPGVIYLFSMKKHFGRIGVLRRRDEKNFLRESLRYGLPTSGVHVLSFLFINQDRYLLRYFTLDDEQWGFLSVAGSLTDQPLNFLFQTLMLAAFPAVAAAYELSGKESASQLINNLSRIYLAVTIPICTLLAVGAGPIVRVFAGKDFWVSSAAMPWLAAAAFLWGLSQYLTFSLHLAKKTHLLFVTLAIAALANVAANWLLIPGRGFVACGLARIVSGLVLVVTAVVISRPYLTWRFPFKSLLRISVCSAATGVAVWKLLGFVPESWPMVTVILCLGGVFYAILIVGCGELPFSEIAHWGRSVRKKTGI